MRTQRLRGRADEIIGRVQSAYGQVGEQAGQTFDTVDAFVTERPYLTAGLAALAGITLGFVLGLALAVVHGEDPALFIAGFEYLPGGQSEYEFAGAIKGAPIEVYPGPQTGLPIPARADAPVFEKLNLLRTEVS